ncbi:hypothetical protein GQ600_16747 [Phytophthora cactorum]|nr:hypothetical protein GQ600_16747 [Phytophthora cactorum]
MLCELAYTVSTVKYSLISSVRTASSPEIRPCLYLVVMSRSATTEASKSERLRSVSSVFLCSSRISATSAALNSWVAVGSSATAFLKVWILSVIFANTSSGMRPASDDMASLISSTGSRGSLSTWNRSAKAFCNGERLAHLVHRLGAVSVRVLRRRKLAHEHVRLLDARRVIQLHGSDAVARRQHSTLRLKETDNTGLRSQQRHVHLHHFDLSVRHAATQTGTVVHQIASELTGRVGHETRGVVLLSEHARVAINHKTQTLCLLEECELDGATTTRLDVVLDTFVDELQRLLLGQQFTVRKLATLDLTDVLLLERVRRLVRAAHSTHENHHQRVRTALQTHFVVVRDTFVQPRRGDAVVLEIIRLHHVDDVLDGRQESCSYEPFHESDSTRTGGQSVSQRTRAPGRRVHREVAPNIGRTAEVEFLDSTTGGLEAGVRVLGGDTRGDNVSMRRLLLLRVEVNSRRLERILVVQTTHIWDAVQRNAHSHLQLGSR